MIRVKNIKLHYGEKKENILIKACRKLRLKPESVLDYSIYKESLDVRKKSDIFYIYTVDIKVKNESWILKNNRDADISEAEYIRYEYPKVDFSIKERPVVVGFGPCGMFAALSLAKMGLRPLVLERGNDADTRLKDIENLMKNGVLNINSNIQFGEGGAGTFSDGKLTSRIKNPRSRHVLEELVRFGAPDEILYSHNPHIGTDRLVGVVKNIRNEIIRLGGEVRFSSLATGIEIENGAVRSVEVNEKDRIICNDIILSVGHSARDTFEMLYSKGVVMRQKPFAVGARIEHSQELINKAQYGDEKMADYFGPAEYKLTYTASDGRGVYTFCMCPGGYVVPAASEKGLLAVNGMSYYSRNGKSANSALLVQVNPEDFGTDHPLGGMYFQRELEKRAFDMAGGGYFAPAQFAGDFLSGNKSANINSILTTYRPGIKMCDLNELFPDFVSEAMREAIPAMGRRLKGFDNEKTLLIAPESRSSSPVRVERDIKTGQSVSAAGLYPCGEGAGYAGGIISAAVDGICTAEMLVKRYNI
ncbi:hypothetical protein MUJ63_08610 [Lachnospiraceae bacterium NSJ-143]|nr:hypothetical protein [Lachnospiraceae bacterium NSJ-143]